MFDKIYRQIFGSRSAKSDEPVKVSGQLKRQETYKNAFLKWRLDGAPWVIRDRLLPGVYPDDQIPYEDILPRYSTPYANGIVIPYDSYFTNKQHFDFFFDWLKEMVLEMPYRLMNADYEMIEKNDSVKLVNRYYIKPDYLVDFDNRRIQQFGNILIQQIYLNNAPLEIRILVTVYNDRGFTEARPFEQLIDHFFQD